MQAKMANPAQPDHFERLGVIRMMGFRLGEPAMLAWKLLNRAPLHVDMKVGARIRPPLLLGVTWNIQSGFAHRSRMAGKAIALSFPAFAAAAA